MESKHIHIIKLIVANLSRFLLAAVFIFSGFVKAIDPLGTMYKIQDYLTAFGWGNFFPQQMPLILSICLSTFEFCVGVFLLFGIRRWFSFTTAVLLMGVMTPLTLYLAIVNPVSNCGCFGDAWVLSNWETFAKNVILLIASFILVKGRRKVTRFITEHTEWIVSMYTFLFIIILSIYCLRNLPLLDFRPYQIGKNISEEMMLPIDAKPDAMPAILDFWMEDVKTGADVTDSVLMDQRYFFLLVAHRMEEANDGYIDLINELYDYSKEYNYGFYCLTSSDSISIEEWKDRTGAEYPFCKMDDITLKTMIRSNPGLILLKGGTIINKWADRNLPDEYALTDQLEKLPIGQPDNLGLIDTLKKLAFWFITPLLIVLLMDYLLIRRRAQKVKATEEKEEQTIQ